MPSRVRPVAPEDAGRPLAAALRARAGRRACASCWPATCADGLREWPEELAVALGTRGFADEVRTLLARARGFGLEPPDLAQFAAEAGARADWGPPPASSRIPRGPRPAGRRSTTPSWCTARSSTPSHRPDGAALRARYDLVVVDEYQDTDPAQERLLTAIAGDGRDLVVVGDPDQSIYSFRGAEVRGLLDFRTRFLDQRGPAGGRRARCGSRGAPAPTCWPPRARWPAGCRWPAEVSPTRCASTAALAPADGARTPARVEVLDLSVARRPSSTPSPTCSGARTSTTGSPWVADGGAGPVRRPVVALPATGARRRRGAGRGGRRRAAARPRARGRTRSCSR